MGTRKTLTPRAPMVERPWNLTLGFGIIGCRDPLPHVQRLALCSRDAIEELERAIPHVRSRTPSAGV